MSQYENYNPPSAGGGGHDNRGTEEEFFTEAEVEAEGTRAVEEVEYDFALLMSMHSLIDGVHDLSVFTQNTKFQMSSVFNKLGYLPPDGTFKKIVANPIGNKTTLDKFKRDLREIEKEEHKQNIYGTIFFKNLIELNIERIIIHNDPNKPESFIYYIPNLFEDLMNMNTNTRKQERIDEFNKLLEIYKEQFILWCPHWDQNLNYEIEKLFFKIEEFIKTNSTQIPNKNAQINPELTSSLKDELTQYLIEQLTFFVKYFDDYNNNYVSEIFGNLRHRTISGNNPPGLPRYNLAGNHPGETLEYTGFSLVLYENKFLMGLWLEYCKQTGINRDSAKTQDGAILRMDPENIENGSPMYMFLRWCSQFLDGERAKESYFTFLEMLSLNYSEPGVKPQDDDITTDTLLFFINLLKQIIVKHYGCDINKLNVYCFMFGCGNFDAQKEAELKESFENIEYEQTQLDANGGRKRRKTRRNKKTRRSRKTR